MSVIVVNNEEDALTAALAAYVRAYGVTNPRMLARVAIGAFDIYHGNATGALDTASSLYTAAAKTIGSQR
jgi:hypothetical protein